MEKDERIYLFFIFPDSFGGGYSKQEFVKNFDEYCEEIESHRYTANIYNSLATVVPDEKGEFGGTKSNMYRRQVMYFDMDRKDFPSMRNATDCTNIIKRKFPDLFIHAVYDSGHGYHCYVSVEPTDQIQKLTDLNKEYATIIGADLQACMPTQIVRIPGTYNLKETHDITECPLEKEVIHYKNYPKQVEQYHAYSFSKLKSILKKPVSQETPADETPSKVNESIGGAPVACFCTEQAFENGVVKGERNIVLGRIIFMLKGEGYPESDIYKECREWNLRCIPAKKDKELDNEIDGYLRKTDQYILNGCWWNIPNGRTREVVKNHCNKDLCPRFNKKGDGKSDEEQKVKVPLKLVSDRRLKSGGKMSLSPNELLVMTVLYKFWQPREDFTVGDLKEKLLKKENQGLSICFSDRTLKKTLDKLQKHHCIEMAEAKDLYGEARPYDENELSISRNMRIKNDEYMEFYYSTAEAFIAGKIKGRDYRAYLCIIRNIHNGESCTEEKIAVILGTRRPNVSTMIHNLAGAGCLKIIKCPGKSGKDFNWYVPLYTAEYHVENPCGVEQQTDDRGDEVAV